MVVMSALESALLPNELDQKSAYKVSERTILQTLNSRQYTKQDISSLFEILDSHRYSNQSQNVAIELHELRHDYVSAFRCLLKEESRHSEIKSWLLHRKQLLEEARDGAQLEQLRQAVKTNFESIAEFDCRISKETQKSLSTRASSVRFSRRQSVATRSFQSFSRDPVVDTFCRNAVEVARAFFDTDLYLLTGLEMFESTPDLQMNYLKSFIVQEEQEIMKVCADFQEDGRNPQLHKMYTKMLTVFILRLCDHEPAQVEEWVSKDYFPTDECLNVCQERKTYLGIAAIMLRKNDGKEAIKNYVLEIEKSIERERFFA